MDYDSGKLSAIKEVLREKIIEFKPREGDSWNVRPLYETRSKDGFASILFIADTEDEATRRRVSLVVKVMPENAQTRENQNSYLQFQNESVMLTNVVPKLIEYSRVKDVDGARSLFPKCYLAEVVPVVEAIIVMENLKEQGYVLTDYIMNYEHCCMSLIALGKYHAMGYAAKHNHPDGFFEEVVGPLEEARYCLNSRSHDNHDFRYYAMHPVNYILNSDDEDLIAFRNKNRGFLTRLVEILQRPADHLDELNLPTEPLATLCHGDFNRNNFMFQYVDGKPNAVKFLDFQTVRYANPGIDIVFFLYLNTTHDLRQRHLDDLLSIYQRTLVESLNGMVESSREELESVYSLSAVKADFERCAMSGYVVCALFDHFMLASVEELVVLDTMSRMEAEEEFTSEEYLKYCSKLGGDVAMKRSLAIIKEMALMTFQSGDPDRMFHAGFNSTPALEEKLEMSS